MSGMKRTYKNIVDLNKKSGNNKNSWAFFSVCLSWEGSTWPVYPNRNAPFDHGPIDHSHSQQPVPRGFPLFKRCEWLVVKWNPPVSSCLRSPPWWNAHCQSAVDERRRITKKYIDSPTISNFQVYRRVRSSCTKTLKRMKRNGWKKFCTQFDFKTPTAEIWSLIKL